MSEQNKRLADQSSRDLSERIEHLEELNSQLLEKNQELTQENEELRDLCAATKIRCKKYESRKAFNTMLKELTDQHLDT